MNPSAGGFTFEYYLVNALINYLNREDTLEKHEYFHKNIPFLPDWIKGAKIVPQVPVTIIRPCDMTIEHYKNHYAHDVGKVFLPINQDGWDIIFFIRTREGALIPVFTQVK